MTMYAINHRNFTAFKPLAQEYQYAANKNYLFDLSYLAAIKIEGEQGKEFLQGQLSCDLREINSLQMRQGAMCNLKGRVLALLDVIDWPEHGLHLILPNDLSESTQASLAKTAALSRTKLSGLTNYHFFGFYLNNRDDVVPYDLSLSDEKLAVQSGESFYCYSLGHNFYLFLVEKEDVAPLINLFSKTEQWRGSLAWHALQLQQGYFQIYPESRGLFLPHRLGLQLSGHLSFNKGCYKGQEIIARTHFRATLKHEMRLFTLTSEEVIASGQKILTEEGTREIGELIDFCPLGAGEFLIAASVVFDCPFICRIEGHQEIKRIKPH